MQTTNTRSNAKSASPCSRIDPRHTHLRSEFPFFVASVPLTTSSRWKLDTQRFARSSEARWCVRSLPGCGSDRDAGSQHNYHGGHFDPFPGGGISHDELTQAEVAFIKRNVKLQQKHAQCKKQVIHGHLYKGNAKYLENDAMVGKTRRLEHGDLVVRLESHVDAAGTGRVEKMNRLSEVASVPKSKLCIPNSRRSYY